MNTERVLPGFLGRDLREVWGFTGICMSVANGFQEMGDINYQFDIAVGSLTAGNNYVVELFHRNKRKAVPFRPLIEKVKSIFMLVNPVIVSTIVYTPDIDLGYKLAAGLALFTAEAVTLRHLNHRWLRSGRP